MITFETFKDIDDAGVVTWRAYFTKDCGYNPLCDGLLPDTNAPVGYGDTELEAISNLCLDEIARIEQEAEQHTVNLARWCPMTFEEWHVLQMLYEARPDDKFFYFTRNDDYAYNLCLKGLATYKVSTTGNVYFSITETGIDYIEVEP